MFRFTAQGRIGKIAPMAKSGLRISVAADRLAEGQQGAYTRTEWLTCISFDVELNRKLELDLEVGMSVKLDGRIEPRKREVQGVTVYDTSFFIERFERLSKPKAAAKPRKETESSAQAAAAA